MALGKRRGAAAEKRVARDTGGELVPHSGAGAVKGDVHAGDLFIEVKSSGRVAADGVKSISVRKDWLLKMQAQQKREGKPYGALVFHFTGDRNDWAIVPLAVLIELLRKVRGEGAAGNVCG